MDTELFEMSMEMVAALLKDAQENRNYNFDKLIRKAEEDEGEPNDMKKYFHK